MCVWVRARVEGRDEGGRWGLEVQMGDGVGRERWSDLLGGAGRAEEDARVGGGREQCGV